MIKLLLILILFFPLQALSYDKSCIGFNYSDTYCDDLFDNLFDKGYKSYEEGDFLGALEFYNEAYRYDLDNSSLNYNLGLTHYSLGRDYVEEKKYDEAILSLKSAERLWGAKYEISYWLGYSYFYQGENKYNSQVEQNLQNALDNASNQEEIDFINGRIYFFENLSIAPSNDTYSWAQYYLHSMNIPDAWKKVTESKEVIVAVIDDGFYLNHPDLQNNLWIKANAKYGESNVINFIDDDFDNLAAGEHGTMVSGIIAATQNNNEGIAGIAKNVKIMPLRVFDLDQNTTPESIINAINFAVDNNANIINLSLGGTQFKYSDKFDDVIKKAYDNGVLVVVAAGNGDVLSSGDVGINLTKNPIAPVCNNGGNYNKYSIGVYSSDYDGWRTDWTNHGDCAPFMAPGMDIISTSVPVFNESYGNDYNELSGTSFSAPIISGIIALGYNQFGEIPPTIVYDSLVNSLVENNVGNKMIDASLYIDELQKYKNNLEKINESSELNLAQTLEIPENKYISIFRKKLGNKLSQIPSKSLNKLIIQIDDYLERDLNQDLVLKLEALKILILEVVSQ